MYVRLCRVSANRYESHLSYDGVSWIAVSAHEHTFTPTHWGLWISGWTSGNPFTGSFHYLRKVTL